MRHALVFTLLFLTTFLIAASPPTFAEEAVHEEKIRILLVTGGHSFEEQPFFALFDSLPDVKMTHVVYPEAAKLLTPDLVQDYDVLVFYDMWTPGITPGQQKAFLQLLQSGIGVVALHHTLAAHPDWPEYANIIGGKYYADDHIVDGKTVPQSRYLHDQDIQATVADPAHPITNGLNTFEIHDETYDRCEVDPTVRVLLTTNHPRNNKELVWVKKYRNSRVCYIQLGHDHHAYENPNYRLLVARGIRWAAGRPADPEAKSFSLFNGKNLVGWRQEGNATWEVKNGLLIGRQGPNQAAGDLLTETSFDDFELTASFKIVWPANSGVWYRYQSAQEAYQADILEYKDPLAYTGSLYCPGKLFLAINDDPKLVHREGWNVLVIRAVGNRHVLFLNGKKIADVRDDGSKRGRIGFQIHEGSQFSKMRIMVKEVRVKRI